MVLLFDRPQYQSIPDNNNKNDAADILEPEFVLNPWYIIMRGTRMNFYPVLNSWFCLSMCVAVVNLDKFML